MHEDEHNIPFFIGGVCIYLAVFGLDHYITSNLIPKGIYNLLYYFILLFFGIYLVFGKLLINLIPIKYQ